MVVVVLGTLRVPPENMQKLTPHLRDFVEATRRVDGCIAYDVAEDIFDRGLIRFSEIWPDAASLATHLQAPHIAPWRGASAQLGIKERRFTAFDAENPRPV
jgi:quinol monooxygenase YgiN